jgi:tRNA C32,U32 (ribose-2'-O)-methylase TrmJ
MMRKAQKAQQKISESRSKYYAILQQWLSETTLPQEHADEVFKRTLKKLFKKEFKDENEFKAAIRASIHSLSNTAPEPQE